MFQMLRRVPILVLAIAFLIATSDDGASGRRARRRRQRRRRREVTMSWTDAQCCETGCAA
jgi:hypothetical protein